MGRQVTRDDVQEWIKDWPAVEIWSGGSLCGHIAVRVNAILTEQDAIIQSLSNRLAAASECLSRAAERQTLSKGEKRESKV